MIPALQQIIGTDKRNPDFTICRDKASPRKLYLFFGAALLETIPEDKTHAEFKLLLARLYNSGIKVKTLIKEFGIARTTIKRWADALKNGDPKILAKALAGAGAPKKLTNEVCSFIELRFPQIYNETHYNYSQIMRKEIEQVFGVPISAESLRLIFNKLKSTCAAVVEEQAGENRADACDSETPEEVLPENAADQQVMIKRIPVGLTQPARDSGTNNPKYSLPFHSNQIVFCHHAGLLIFSNAINSFKNRITDRLSKQFLATVLLGAKNIEQTKLLDFSALRVILGTITAALFTQRRQLTHMATDENISDLLKFNAELVNAKQYTDFYFDPHTKHYTGAEKILKGWCAAIRSAGKIVNMDFMHIAPDGHPVYIKHDDNYYDMRERFLKVLTEFRTVIGGSNNELTFIVDRGIYSFKLFETIVSDNHSHIITWEKGYKRNLWDTENISGEFSTFRQRNNSRDPVKYDFKYIDQPWKKNDAMRQIIVRATNPKKNMIEVSILADDKTRSAEQIIRLMFSRWVQENDFKYEGNHFGINEITSYASISYNKLQNLGRQKQTKLGQYKALELNARDIKNKLKQTLFKHHTIKSEKKKAELEKNIQLLNSQLEQTKQHMSETQKQGSKLDELLNKEFRKLDTDNKAYMDCIKIIARNMFYKALESFKEKYDNYRDDHVIFRNLTQAHGLITFTREGLTVTVFPTSQHSPKLRRIIEKVFCEINNTKPELPDGSRRIVTLELGKKIDDILSPLKADPEDDTVYH